MLFDLNLSIGCGRVKHLVHHTKAGREGSSAAFAGSASLATVLELDDYTRDHGKCQGCQ